MLNLKSLIIIPISTTILLSACAEKQSSEPAPKPISTSSSTSSAQTDANSNEPVVKPKTSRGASLYKRCQVCHTLNEGGPHKVGPNLYGVFGSTAGSAEGFRYSKTMAESGLVWTDENLAAYINSPARFMPGNSMAFAGIRKDEDIALLLEYMREKTSE